MFHIGVSIEKDPVAHRTLTLRAAFRMLKDAGRLDHYYAYLRGDLDRDEFLQHPMIKQAMAAADEEAHCAELGKVRAETVDSWIGAAIGKSNEWVLIGGPPCQAYSLAGRSRRVNDKTFEQDEKHFLYKEYLRIIRKFSPPVFVMENVKGLLSSQHDGSGIFSKILEDLARPVPGVEYEIRSFVTPSGIAEADKDYVIRAELYGIPQKRHRVILLGVRKDFASRRHTALMPADSEAKVRDFLTGLPSIRSTVSRRTDAKSTWIEAISKTPLLLNGWKHDARESIVEIMRTAITRADSIGSSGARFTYCPTASQRPAGLPALQWILDEKLGGVCQHQSRGHMEGDLQRYLFAACYGRAVEQSPKLKDFPSRLLPAHENASDDDAPFKDRFRVQLRNQSSSTVVSHIAKDGHYYIHYDPKQCRSLTVREAARLQTFPDNYFFEGNRTEQYGQVGNAVPPYLARQLAISAASIFGIKC